MTKLLTSIFLLFTVCSYGQTKQNSDKDKNRINVVCDNIMQKFVSGNTDEAMEILKKNTAMSAGTIDTLKLTVADQVQNIFPQFGTLLSAEFIKEKNAKNFIAKRFYAIKFTKFCIKVDFTLYDSGNGWTITSFHYNEDVDELLD